MIYHHVHQPVTNELLEYNSGQGSVNWIFQRRYLSQDLGSVFSYLQNVLEKAQWPLVYYTDFHLVNLYSPFYKTSHGICPPPPSQVIVPCTRLSLTFSLRGTHYSEPKHPYRIRYNDWSYMWGDGILNAHDFFTINIPILDYRLFKFRAMLPLNMYCTYNLLSMLTKNFVVNYRRTRKEKALSLYDLNNTCLHLHFGDFINRKPWWLLPYSRFVWRRGINLLTQMITADVSLYYALYLTDVPPIDTVEGDLRDTVLYGDNGIQRYLTESIQRFFDLQPTKLQNVDLLFPAFVYPAVGSDYEKQLTEQYRYMQDVTSGLYSEDKQAALAKWGLYPYDELARKLVQGDKSNVLTVFGE